MKLNKRWRTLQEVPHVYLRNRAARLAQLIELEAPNVIIHSALVQLLEAAEAWRKANPMPGEEPPANGSVRPV